MYRLFKTIPALLILAFLGAGFIANSQTLGPSPSPGESVCTMDAKLCPDGKTYVGRVPPTCEFAPCPEEKPCQGKFCEIKIDRIVPLRGKTGTLVYIWGSGFTPKGNNIHFGVGGIKGVRSSLGGRFISFRVPDEISACDLLGPECKAMVIKVRPGFYPVSASNNLNRSSNSLQFTVTK